MKKKSKGTPAGREIIAALTDLRDTLAAGIPLEEKYTVRHVVVPAPGTYNARAVRATRDRLGISQRVFANLLGVSLVLVQAWEQGKRIPNATARRLLDEINREPHRWAAMLRPANAA
jgi:DNA-binding transcriptional regulator YiaG